MRVKLSVNPIAFQNRLTPTLHRARDSWIEKRWRDKVAANPKERARLAKLARLEAQGTGGEVRPA